MPEQKEHWLVRSSTIRMSWIVSCLVLAGLVAADFIVSHDPHFGLDGTFGFSAWFGFVACVALVAVARAVGAVFKRRDDYYGD